MLRAAWLAAALLGAGAAQEAAGGEAGRVPDLDNDTFAVAVKANPLLFVAFYAPWCGHSKQLEPEFEKAALALEGRVPFAKVDATYETDLALAYDIDGYPTIFFFRDGVREEYTGNRDNSSLVTWLVQRSGSIVSDVASEAALKERLDERGTPAIFVAKGGASLKEVFTQVADYNRLLGTYLFLERSAGPAVVEVHRGIDERVEMPGAAEAVDAQRLLEFFRTEVVATFGEIGEENYQVYNNGRSGVGMVWAIFSAESFREDARRFKDVFREAAMRFPQFPFVYVDAATYAEHVELELGCSEPPAVVLQVGNLSSSDTEAKRYMLAWPQEGLTAAQLSSWLADVLAGKVEAEDPLDLPDGADDHDVVAPQGGFSPEDSATAAAPPRADGASASDMPPPAAPAGVAAAGGARSEL